MTISGIGRRRLLQAATGITAVAATTALPGAPALAGQLGGAVVLQPHTGRTRGRYLPATPDTVSWGRLPNRDTRPALVVDSGSVLTIDTISHEGLLEDQGKDPLAYFTDHGMRPSQVLTDAIDVAAKVEHDGPGPHVVTGPIAVRGAEPGHTLKIEVLDLQLRVPYGVVSNRHGKGALPGEYPERWKDRPELAKYFNSGGNISVFTGVARRGRDLVGVLPGGAARFPLAPFLGLMGVARDTSALVNSVPPTDAGGNIDINDLRVGSTLYLPVRVAGGMFFTGDPHMAQGDGEVALTAMEGSLRATVRLTTIPPAGRAPKLAFDEPFAENAEHWIPIGLSDADGPENGQETSLDVAMKRAVRSALRFLTEERGMPEPVAYAYLSAAADFQVSQVVDITTGIHGLIRKSDFHS
ncbi:acetamidase/formamidase family protein [Prauserella flavalba]|uniref:Acetamidase n=1 Tax=Prauserella flavalba TaxID=1477506 RepID=A0A318M4G6_9PSEU|nr:acetamidase/formamidase family protein [Prauserella flavalba]PXY26361.1 acetamidase [Prauserella flavalba]